MTARVITLKGPDAGRYYVEEVGEYYLDNPEAPGRWRGAGAAALGLTGELDEDDFLAVIDGLHPETGATLGTGHTDRTVRGFDVTCSAPKSVSLLFAVGDVALRDEVLAAHDAAVDAMVDWLEAHAHTRFRVNGEIWTVDAQGIAAALFREHTSRAHDPQVHTHVVIPNRVLAPDGRWLALDARTLKCDQRTMSALYHAGLRAELTRRIGARWHPPENGIAEMADADPAVLAAFSERTRQVERRAEDKVERFADTFDRPPTSRERWRLEREAVAESRPTKTSVDAATLYRRWLDQLDDLGVDRDDLIDGIVDKARPMSLDDDLAETVMADAERSLHEKQSTWRLAELTRELAAAVPTRVAGTASAVGEWVEELEGRMEDERLVDISRRIPGGVPLRRDGRPVTESAVDRLLTTGAILDEEEWVLTLAQRWADRGGTDRHDLAADDLSAVQHQAAAAVAGDRRLVLVVGPAGTGKTTALRPAVERLRADGRAVFGVAPSATAAEVLAVDTGIDADTVDKLLVEHRLRRRPAARYDLPAGATVVVDEAAMVPTPRLAELVDLAERRQWRVALVGDPMQFSAVGRSGMFGHLVETVGATELDRVHRFHADWERAASLRLRRGDTDVVALYDRHDRLHGGTAGQMARATVAAWRQATIDGETAAMMAPTREAVSLLNGLAQAMRMGAGEIDPQSPSVRVGEHRVHVGDVVATRRNERQLRTNQGRMVKNRDRWTIEALQSDGGLTVAGTTGRVRLPGGYVAAHVELAYAKTSHANQGRTVDRSFLYLDGPADTQSIYVPLTRGRTTNEAFVTITGEQTAAEVVAEAVSRTWIDQPATALRADREPQPTPLAVPRPTTVLPEPELRALVARAVALEHQEARRSVDALTHSRNLGRISFDRRQALDSVARIEEQLARAEETLAARDRPLHRRGHRDTINEAKDDIRRLPADLERVQKRIEQLDDEAQRETHQLRVGGRSLKRAARQTATDQVRTALDDDAQARGTNAAADPSPRLVASLGHPPASGPGRAAWVEAAGRLAQHHQLFPIPPGQLFGPRPRAMGQDDYAHTHHAAQRAVTDLDQTLGHERAPERPGPALMR